jgi:ABC-type lipoprotein release transport system permease subunit
VKNWDPVALGVAVGALALCAFAAAVIPARRAASIPAVDALREE